MVAGYLDQPMSQALFAGQGSKHWPLIIRAGILLIFSFFMTPDCFNVHLPDEPVQ
jgi:hypothetical protein